MINNIRRTAMFLLLTTLLSTDQNTRAEKPFANIKANKKTLYFGSVKTNQSSSNLCMLYDGEFIPVSDDVFTIRDQMRGGFHIVIVDPEKLNFDMEQNTVKNIKLGTGKYQCFYVEATQATVPNAIDHTLNTWTIKEKKLDGALPPNSIVVPISPDQIQVKIKNVTWRPSNRFVKLPLMELQVASNYKLSDILLESYLKCISLNPFYAKQKVTSVVKDSLKISMIL